MSNQFDQQQTHTYKLLNHFKDYFEFIEGSNLLIINEEITKKICDALKCEDQAFRTNIRATLPHVVDIGSTYAILFGRSRITVRTNLKESSQEKRFMGLPSEALEEIVQKHFKNLDEEIPHLMKETLINDFNFQTMSNELFESEHIKYLQNGLMKIIKRRSNQDNEVRKALTNYILRQQFNKLHEMLAEQLLEGVINKNPKAEQFLKFYAQGMIVIRGEKYQIPQLIDIQGTLWSMANITNVAFQYQSYKQSLLKKDSHIDQMGTILDTIDNDIAKALSNVKILEQTYQQNKLKLQQTAEKISTIRHTFSSEGDKLDEMTRNNLGEKVKSLEKEERDQIAALQQQEKALGMAQKKHSDLQYKKSVTTERHDNEIDLLEETQETHEDIEKKYRLMLTAVVKALTGKKRKVSLA